MIALPTEGVQRFAARSRLKYVLAFGALLALPYVTSPLLASEVLLFAIFAIGYNLLAGYGGELSLGHAGIFGAGCYTYILSLETITSNFYLALLLALVVGSVIGTVFAFISLRRRGIYFAMITLALAQILFFLVIHFEGVTGGRDGIAPPASVSGAVAGFEPIGNVMHLYFFALMVLVLVWLGVYRVVNSPFGHALTAIRENERRAVHLGYEPNRILTLAFGLSGAISALAGAVYVAVFVYITANVLHWSLSGDVLLMTIMGGFGSLNGPVAGAAAFVLLSHYVVELIDYWEMLFGAIIMVIILFLPGGLVELIKSVTDRLRRP